MHAAFGPLQVTLKYTYTRNSGTIIYQRAIPSALKGRYASATVKLDLKTKDVAVASKKVAVLNKRYEAEWDALLLAPDASPVSLVAHADALLRGYGLAPGAATDTPSADSFIDRLTDKHHAYADSFGRGKAAQEAYEAAEHGDFLTTVEHMALKRLNGHVPPPPPPSLTNASEFHLSQHAKRNNQTFTTYQRRAMASLVAVVGDKAISAFTRDDARTYVTESCTKVKSTTVRRMLNALSPVFITWGLDKDKAVTDPFKKIAIPDENKDAKPRTSFTAENLARLYALCQSHDDARRWLLALLIDTGARLAEVTGLALSDIHLDAPVPYIRIQPHPWRTLKNPGSVRTVPLVGASLWAAQRITGEALPGQLYAFPRYTTATACNAHSASAALRKWLVTQGFTHGSPTVAHVPHELRHTMADRLRNEGCPKEIRYAIDGHASQDVGDNYGQGHGLPILHQWLAKVALVG